SQPPEAQLVKVGVWPTIVDAALRFAPFSPPLEQELAQPSPDHLVQGLMDGARAMVKICPPTFQTTVESGYYFIQALATGSWRKLADSFPEFVLALFPRPLIAPFEVPSQ